MTFQRGTDIVSLGGERRRASDVLTRSFCPGGLESRKERAPMTDACDRRPLVAPRP